MLDYSLVMVAAVRCGLLHGDDRLGARHHAHHPLLPLPQVPLPLAPVLLLLQPPVAMPLPTAGAVLRLDLPRVAAMHGDPAADAAAAHRALAVVDQAARYIEEAQ